MIGQRTSTGRVKPLKVETIRSRAYQELKQALLEGQLQPGELVTVREIAEAFGVGAMPVREAIQQLVTEGGLEVFPNRTVRVPRLSDEEIAELFAVRRQLEGFAASEAAKWISPGEIAAVKASYRSMKGAWRGLQAGDALAANIDLHFKIYGAAHSSYLEGLIERLWLRIGPLLILPYRSSGAARKAFLATLDTYKRLVEAVAGGDGDAAEAALGEILAATHQWLRDHRASA